MTDKNYELLRVLIGNNIRFDLEFLYDLNQVLNLGLDVFIPVPSGVFVCCVASFDTINNCRLPFPDYAVVNSEKQLVHFWRISNG